MLIQAYVFALILGGVLLVASMVSGHDDAEVSGHTDGAAGSDPAPGHVDQAHASDGAGVLAAFVSLRFWTFFLAFFGVTGLVLDGLDVVQGSVIPAVIAGVLGLAAGSLAVWLLRRLSQSGVARGVTHADYVGKEGRILVGCSQDEVGKVRIEIRGNIVDVLARSIDTRAFGVGDKVILVELRDTTALVSATDDLAAPPS